MHGRTHTRLARGDVCQGDGRSKELVGRMEFTQDLIRSLHSSAVFEGIPVNDLRDLLREIDARVMELSEGQLLRRAGDKLDFYPVVIEGSVLATMPQGGQDRPVAQFGPGESFAEAVPATLKHTPVNICAQEPTRILCIPAKQLEACTNPHAFLVRENLSAEMSKKIGVLTKTLSVVGEPRLSDRILAYLRTLPADADGRVEIPVNRQEWASYLRVADKSLIRELRAMQNDGLLEVDGRHIRVL